MTDLHDNFSDNDIASRVGKIIDNVTKNTNLAMVSKEVGKVVSFADNVINVTGFSSIGSEEEVIIAGSYRGFVSLATSKFIKIVPLDNNIDINVGDEVRRTGRSVTTIVGEELIGRVVDGLGRPIDGLKPLKGDKQLPAERPARPIVHRYPVSVPLQTGIKVIDALVPIGRGQRELILGDRQTGKTSIALDAIVNQKGRDIICIYCAIGSRTSNVAKIVKELKMYGAMDYTIVVKADCSDTASLRFLAPYSATSMAEYFMDKGKDVLIVYDDLTSHARAYREMSLLLERIPGREAFPGDIFYVHSRLLERSARIKPEYGGGSITSLPIIETEAENVSAYIPTNVISITDGQIYLSPSKFQKGLMPAVDIGRSVSRVGSNAQLKAYKSVASTLRVSFSQFEELETFSRFATKLDKDTQNSINRGCCLRQIFKQDRYETLAVYSQIAIYLCVTNGLFDDMSNDQLASAQGKAVSVMSDSFSSLVSTINNGSQLSASDIDAYLATMKQKLVVE